MKHLLSFMLCVFLIGCEPLPLLPPSLEDKIELKEVSFSSLSGWERDNFLEAVPAFLRSCEAFQKMPPNAALKYAGEVKDWLAVCARLKARPLKTNEDARIFFEQELTPYQVLNKGAAEGLFTGYFEASLRGDTKPSPAYPIPLYKRPQDLIVVEDLGLFRPSLKGVRLAGQIKEGRLKPYHTRADIQKGILKDRELEIIWVDNPVDAFFLEVQGSGRVHLKNGQTLRLKYDWFNGHEYTSIGKEMVKRGHLSEETVSMQSIKQWLKENPEELHTLFNLNKSYVFFEILKGEGPIGSLGVPLTPERSLAVDKLWIPLGVPLWLDIEAPKVPFMPETLQKLVLAQDTGGAIKGIVRGDLFWGYGKRAEEAAGPMKSKGHLYIFLPKGVVPKI